MDLFRPDCPAPSIQQASELLHVSGVPIAVAARVLAREPASPVTRTLKLWGDDEDPFRHLITATSKEARVWRETMGILIENLAPAAGARPVWRGWHFGSDHRRDSLMRLIEGTGHFRNLRVGMSASRSRHVAIRPEFLNHHGVLWEIRHPRSARNLAPIFRAIGAKYPAQREVVFPAGTRFRLVSKPGWVTIRGHGQSFRVRHHVLEEI
jgi:hypothetical protein